MIRFTKIRVRSLDIDNREVSWEIEDTQEDTLDYTFQVFRSESVAGPWEQISVPFRDRYFFIDRAVPGFHFSRQLQYKVVAKHRVSNETTESEVADIQADADLVTLEVRRHLRVLMREFIGRRTWLLPVRTFGQRCVCWDARRQKSNRDGCPSCYGTGFLRGYLAPVELWMQFDTGGAMGEQTTGVGAQQQQNTTARIPYFGPIKPRDILIEGENLRWRVVSVNQTEHVRSPVQYELQLHLIPNMDIEYKYKLPLEEDLKDLYLSPPRNFTNPQNVDSVGDAELPDFLTLFPTTYTKG